MPGSKKAVALVLKTAVSVLLIALLVYYASPQEILHAISTADLWLLLTFVPLILAATWLAALQLKIFVDCHGMNVGLWRIVEIDFATEFYNLFLPGSVAGGAVRWYKLSRGNNMGVQAFAVIVLNRLVNTFALLALGLAGWLLQGGHQEHAFIGVLLASGLLGLTFGVLLLSFRGVTEFAQHRVLASTRIKPVIREKLAKVIEAMGEYRRISVRDRCRLGLYAAGGQLLLAGSTFLFCMALGMATSFTAILSVRALVTMAMLLPLSISGFGVREVGWVYGLGLYGAAPADAFVLSILTFVRTLFKACIGLVVELKSLLWGARLQESS